MIIKERLSDTNELKIIFIGVFVLVLFIVFLTEKNATGELDKEEFFKSLKDEEIIKKIH